MTQLRQRIAVQTRLDALTAAEVVHYIGHRLQVAGYSGTELFTPGALGLIAERSRGIPRLINNLCFNALSLGCATHQKQITSEVIRQAALDLSLEARAPTTPVLRHQTAPTVTPGFRLSLQSFYSWIRDNLFRRRLIETTVLSLVCVSLVIHFGAHTGAGTSRPSAEIHPDTPTTAAILGSEPRSARPVAEPLGDPPPR